MRPRPHRIFCFSSERVSSSNHNVQSRSHRKPNFVSHPRETALNLQAGAVACRVAGVGNLFHLCGGKRYGISGLTNVHQSSRCSRIPEMDPEAAAGSTYREADHLRRSHTVTILGTTARTWLPESEPFAFSYRTIHRLNQSDNVVTMYAISTIVIVIIMIMSIVTVIVSSLTCPYVTEVEEPQKTCRCPCPIVASDIGNKGKLANNQVSQAAPLPMTP